MYVSMGKSNVTTHQQFFHPFQVDFLQYRLSFTDIHLDCTRWCAFIFLNHFGNKSQCCCRGNHISCMIISPMHSIHIRTDGTTVTSLSANFQHKTSATRDHLCQIAVQWKISLYRLCQFTLKRKLSPKSKERCKFSSRIKAKSRKRNHVKEDLPILLCCQYLLDCRYTMLYTYK
jgi:hypothetical protein